MGWRGEIIDIYRQICNIKRALILSYCSTKSIMLWSAMCKYKKSANTICQRKIRYPSMDNKILEFKQYDKEQKKLPFILMYIDHYCFSNLLVRNIQCSHFQM